MNLLTRNEIRTAEEITVRETGISMVDLMDRASTLFANWIDKKLLKDNMQIAVICGMGNNGGDGLTIARILRERGEHVHVYQLHFKSESALYKQALERYEGGITFVNSVDDLEGLAKKDLVVDAILGVGANRCFDDPMIKIINFINSHSRHIMAVDIPSGMLAEGFTDHDTILAHETMTFTCPKESFFSSTNEDRLGKWITKSIDLVDFRPKSNKFILTKEVLKNRLFKRKKFTHKGTYGNALLVGGESGKAGAIILAARACLRIGAGLVTIGSSEINRHIIQSSSLESMYLRMGESDIANYTQALDRFDVIGIGPGLGQSGDTIEAFCSFIRTYEQSLVLDADALNIISRMQLVDSIFPASILTPHPGEFDRLFGQHSMDMDRVITQVEQSKKRKIYIVLKDAYTTISTPEGDLYYNINGNPGMATAGSGDVLTGIITGLVSQNYSPLEACLLGVYLHGYAGDDAAKNIGEMSMLSSDIINYLPAAIRALSI